MIIVVLLGVLALAVIGCVCVVWTERGGPRWVRVMATVTLAAGELVRQSRMPPTERARIRATLAEEHDEPLVLPAIDKLAGEAHQLD
jgi:hypothetical protein